MGEHQKKLSAVHHRQTPGGLLQAGRHINFAIFSDTQWKCDTRSTTDSLQWETCKLEEDQAARPTFRPPGPTGSCNTQGV